MNTFSDLVRMRIDDLLGLADRVRGERELRAEADVAPAGGTVLAATTDTSVETAGPGAAAPTSDPQTSDCPECPASVRAA